MWMNAAWRQTTVTRMQLAQIRMVPLPVLAIQATVEMGCLVQVSMGLLLFPSLLSSQNAINNMS